VDIQTDLVPVVVVFGYLRCPRKAVKYGCSLFRQKGLPMSPARQPNGSPRERKIARQTPIDPTLQPERNAIIPRLATKKRRDFNPHEFLATIGEGRKSVLFQRKQGIFAQGDAADAVFYIQTGKVKLTVVSKTGNPLSSMKTIVRRSFWAFF